MAWGSVRFLAVFSHRLVSADMPAPQQTKQEDKEQSPEQEINHQPEPIDCKLHYKGIHKPVCTVPRPIHLCDPRQRETPTGARKADYHIDIRRAKTRRASAHKPCEQCRHDSKEYGALHKKQCLSTGSRFQYSDAPIMKIKRIFRYGLRLSSWTGTLMLRVHARTIA